jgi:large exoprotein involved in heme utilization and adhesion
MALYPIIPRSTSTGTSSISLAERELSYQFAFSPNPTPSVQLVDTLNIIDTSCAAFADGKGSQFTVTGRGGLPPNPYEPLSTDVIWSDTRMRMLPLRGGEARKLGDRENSTTSPHHPVTSSIPKTHDGVPIVPATGWVFDGKGNVTLISHASNANGLGSTAATCSKR